MALSLVGIGIIICVILSGVFSAAEMSLSSCNELRMENEAKDGKKSAKIVMKLIDNYDDTLSAILLSNNLVNIAASALSTVYIILLTGSDALNWLITVIVTILIIILGETVPKVLARHFANGFALGIGWFINLLSIILKPVNLIVVGIVNVLTFSLSKKELEKSDEEESFEELQAIIDTASDEGVIDAEQSDLVTNAIDFSDVSASDVMTARVDVEAIDINDSALVIRRKIIKSTKSRMPVYEGSIDNVIGIVHLNQLLKAMAGGGKIDIRSLMLEPCYVYKTAKLPHVLEVLKKARIHMAIVSDEYSGTCGIITMEDVLEEIVGDIWDETDVIEEEVIERDDGCFIIDGDMPIDDFVEYLGISEDDFPYQSQTAGGFVIEFFGDFPKEGDEFEFGEYTIKALRVEGRRVERVEVKKIKKA